MSDVGGITLPVRAAQAKRLIAAARPAMFGRGEETLRDSAIRDTWELTPAHVTLGGPEWDTHLETALTHFRDELGLPPGSQLRASLHSWLVYGKGQFFLPHQDSEKHDDMVATLVVSLPSMHTGGELVVDDGGTERTYRGSRDDLVLVAFYADRRHEVRPVRSGYRVTLTFNLMLTRAAPATDAGPIDETAHCLTEHFTSPARSRYGESAGWHRTGCSPGVSTRRCPAALEPVGERVDDEAGATSARDTLTDSMRTPPAPNSSQLTPAAGDPSGGRTRCPPGRPRHASVLRRSARRPPDGRRARAGVRAPRPGRGPWG